MIGAGDVLHIEAERGLIAADGGHIFGADITCKVIRES